MSAPQRVLIVDDQVGDLGWLLDVLEERGYAVTVATNEDAARAKLRAVQDGKDNYSLAIIDVMVAVKDLLDLVDVDEQFFEDSRSSGIRICRYARTELGLSAKRLPIACLTVRDDDDVKTAMAELDIPLFNRLPNAPTESIRSYSEEHLPRRTPVHSGRVS